MGVAALVLGIVSVIFGFIPFCGYIAFIPAVVGLILGIVHVSKESKVEDGKKGLGIAGIVLNAIAIIFIIFYTIVFVGGAKDVADALQDVDWNVVTNEMDY